MTPIKPFQCWCWECPYCATISFMSTVTQVGTENDKIAHEVCPCCAKLVEVEMPS